MSAEVWRTAGDDVVALALVAAMLAEIGKRPYAAFWGEKRLRCAGS